MQPKLIAFAFLLIFMGGCKRRDLLMLYPGEISEALPKDSSPLKKFPQRFYGVYEDSAQNCTISINDSLFIECERHGFRKLKDNLPSWWVLKGDSVFNKYNGDKGKATFKGDSIIYEHFESDTTRLNNDSLVVKQYKGCLFINHHHKDNGWYILSYELSKGILIGNIYINPLEVKFLGEAKVSPEDTIAPNFDWTKKRSDKYDIKAAIDSEYLYYLIKRNKN